MWDLDNVIEIHVEPLIINVGKDSSTSEWDDESESMLADIDESIPLAKEDENTTSCDHNQSGE
ncbi:hypothetical protein ILUMI_19592, partial [Ignelater luminosus]